MSVGTYLSGTGHAALVVWMVAGWGMSADPLPFEVTDVSIVSGAEFAALTQNVQPDLPPNEPAQIEQPVIEDTVAPPAEETPPEVAPPPPAVVPPAPEAPPEAPDLSVPETIVTDAPPDVPSTPTIVAPPPSAEVGSSTRPVPRPASRVAPEIVAPPPPDAAIAPDTATAATQEADVPAQEDVVEQEETTAPEEAADEIVTEAEEPAFAPEVSSRPQTRPQRTAVAETPTEETVDPIQQALSEAGAATQPTEPTEPTPPTAPTPGLSGGDISGSDKASILRQIGSCWSLGSASSAAMRTSVTVQFSLEAGGRLDAGSIQMTDYSGGTAQDAEVIYRAARSALVRCNNAGNRQGYDVPAEQFQTRRDLQLVFDPSQMALR